MTLLPQNAITPFFFILCLFLFSLPPFPVLDDPDVGWHIAAGQEIVSTRSIPEKDPFSFTAGDTRWYNLSWLYDVSLALLHDHFGVASVFFVTVMLYALSVSLLAAECIRSGAGFLASVVCLSLSLGVIGEGISARPQIASLIMCQLFYRLLKTSGRWMFLLPILMLLWVNLHGGFLAGFVIIVCFMVDPILKKNKKELFTLAGIGVLTILATLVNPWGIDIYACLRKISDVNSARYITEWRTVELGKDIPPTIYLVLFILAAKFSSTKIILADKLLALFWLMAGLSSIRFMQAAAVLATPFVAISLKDKIENSVALTGLESDFMKDAKNPKVRLTLTGFAVLAILILAVPGVQRTWHQKEIAIGGEVKEVVSVLEKKCHGRRILNDYNLGGPLIYQSGGRIKTFIDGRVETAYPPEIIKDYAGIFAVEADWKELLKKYNIGCTLVAKDTRLSAFLTKDLSWVKVFEDDEMALYSK